MMAAALSGTLSPGNTRPTETANAAADAAWPEGNEVDDGIRTHRLSGTPSRVRPGRRRLPASFIGWLITNEVSPIAAIPVNAARRPRAPPNRASAPATSSHGLEKFAKSAIRRSGLSSSGVGISATA